MIIVRLFVALLATLCFAGCVEKKNVSEKHEKKMTASDTKSMVRTLAQFDESTLLKDWVKKSNLYEKKCFDQDCSRVTSFDLSAREKLQFNLDEQVADSTYWHKNLNSGNYAEAHDDPVVSVKVVRLNTIHECFQYTATTPPENNTSESQMHAEFHKYIEGVATRHGEQGMLWHGIVERNS